VDYAETLVPAEARLPVDPLGEVPDGYGEDQRDRPGGFTGEPDVFDTWATSSLSPQIAAGSEEPDDLSDLLFPMDLRPQSHEIIRTWLFYAVVRAEMEQGSLPWSTVQISGWVVDPDRKKMSKSRGNVVTPADLLERYGSDAVRYWAASGRPGVDTAFDEAQMRVGRRLAIKLLNASRFALTVASQGDDAEVVAPLDRAMLARLSALVAEVTEAFESYDYARALERTEAFFWGFCDNYLELVKERAYGTGPAAASAHAALRTALSVLLRLFAPFLPFVTEEVWSWWQPGSVHRAQWPDLTVGYDAQDGDVRVGIVGGDPMVFGVAADVLGEVRKAKSAARASMRAPVARVTVRGSEPELAAVRAAASDLEQAGHIEDLELRASEAFGVEVELAAHG
jgi:valyl-tRNA synthetase